MPRMPFLLLLVAACAARDASVATDAQTRLVGLRADDLRLCSGVPDRRESSDGGEFWTYVRTPPSSGLSLPVPVAGGAVSLSSASNCYVTFQLVQNHVTRIGYSAASEFGLARDSACAPVVQGCLRMLDQGQIQRDWPGPRPAPAPRPPSPRGRRPPPIPAGCEAQPMQTEAANAARAQSRESQAAGGRAGA